MATFPLYISTLYIFYILNVIDSSSKYPYPYENGVSECNNIDSPPPILSFHVHVTFDGTNESASHQALDLYASFIEYINPKMEECPFSHPNSAEFYTQICYFPFNASMTAFPFSISPIFGATDYSFFLPNTDLLIADLWWRQHYNPQLTSFMIHPNTGCEDNSHTIWAMVSENYPYKINKTDFFCCHDGPAKCYCDLVQYVADDNLCLTANYTDYSISLKECADSADGQYDDSNFIETYYNETFIQLENFGPTDGYTRTNTYMCLGQADGASVCERGNEITLIECYQNDERLNLFNWVDNKIKSLNCAKEDLCINFHQKNNQFVLDDCVNSTNFNRAWYNPMP